MGRQDAARPVDVSHALNRFTQGKGHSFWRPPQNQKECPFLRAVVNSTPALRGIIASLPASVNSQHSVAPNKERPSHSLSPPRPLSLLREPYTSAGSAPHQSLGSTSVNFFGWRPTSNLRMKT